MFGRMRIELYFVGGKLCYEYKYKNKLCSKSFVELLLLFAQDVNKKGQSKTEIVFVFFDDLTVDLF